VTIKSESDVGALADLPNHSVLATDIEALGQLEQLVSI
jgi:hypothetical protein